MSCPTEGLESAAFGNNIDTLKDTIELKHGRAYRIYNLSQKPFRKEKFSQHVIDLGAQMPKPASTAVQQPQPPPVSLMLKMCAHVCKYLSESPSNVVFICCNDGRAVSCVAAVTLLLYTRAAASLDSALSAFVCKRTQVELPRSLIRYLRYTARLLALARSPDPTAALGRFNSNECILTSITLIGVPIFNRLRFFLNYLLYYILGIYCFFLFIYVPFSVLIHIFMSTEFRLIFLLAFFIQPNKPFKCE